MNSLCMVMFFISNTEVFISVPNQFTALEIMERYVFQQKSATESAEVMMVLTNKAGKSHTRKLQMTSRTAEDESEWKLIRFTFPSDIEGTGLLTHEPLNGEDERWLYLPAMRKVRRISASEKADNFMGTDFSYEDLAEEELNHWRYQLLPTEQIDDRECYVIEATPFTKQEQQASGYSKKILWIDMLHFVLIQAKYFDKKGELSKAYAASNIKEIDSKFRAHTLIMENLKTGHSTTLTMEQISLNQPAEARLFTLRHLERGY